MKPLALVLATAFVLSTLSACGEKSQDMGSGKTGAAPWAGTGVAAFTAPGWKPGDKASWEGEMRARTQRGQNDYQRIGN